MTLNTHKFFGVLGDRLESLPIEDQTNGKVFEIWDYLCKNPSEWNDGDSTPLSLCDIQYLVILYVLELRRINAHHVADTVALYMDEKYKFREIAKETEK